MYAKINGSNILVYPYGFDELKTDNPYTNFSTSDVFQAFSGTEANLRGETLVPVSIAAMPTFDPKTQIAVQSTEPTLVNGNCVIGWTITQKTSDELASEQNSQAASVRQQRNAKLTACDWTQVADAPVDKAAWATYRQALRDLPKENGFPWTMTWPSEPT